MRRQIVTLALVAVLGLGSLATAGKKGGGGGGGGGDPEPSGPLMVELSTAEGLVLDINELNTIVDEAGDVIWEGVEAVGWSAPPGDHRSTAMHWKIDSDGTAQETILLSTTAPSDREARYSRAAGVNNHSVIVGFGYDDTGEPAEWPTWPLLWSKPSAQAFLLPIPDGYSRGQAWHVNDDGIVVGYVWNDTECCVIAWKVDFSGVTPVVKHKITFLPGSSWYTWPWFRARIAQSGIGVANRFDVVQGLLDAYRFELLWDGSELQVRPGTEEPVFDGVLWSEAFDVNDSGWVSGEVDFGVNDEAFVIDDTGHLVNLETLPPAKYRGQSIEYTNFFPMAINNDGVSVGRAAPEPYVVSPEAVMWGADGAVTLLPEYWRYSQDINDAVWIGGESRLGTPAVLIPQP